MIGDRGKTNVAALVSGGVESAALLQRLVRRGARVQPLYVRQGYRWEAVELRWLRRLLRQWPPACRPDGVGAGRRTRVAPLIVLDAPIKPYAPHHWALRRGPVPGARSLDRAMYLPGRNLFLVIAAGVWCAQHGIRRIAHGTLATNPFPDASPDFFRGMSFVLSRACLPPRRGRGRQALRGKFQLEAPLRHLTKAQVVRRVPPQLLALTFSCINPQPRPSGRGQRHQPCGRCNKCAERHRALRHL